MRCVWMEMHERTLSHHLVGGSGRYVGTVMTEGEVFGDGTERVMRYGLDLRQVAYDDGTLRPAKGNVYWYTADTERAYRIGDCVQIAGRIGAFHYYRNPGNILLEYRRRAQDYIGNVYEQETAVPVVVGVDSSYRWPRYIQSVRAQIHTFLDSHMTSRETAALAESLLFGGNYRQLPVEVVNDFATTGMIHILSVSGSHISLLFGVLMGAGALFGVSRKVAFVGAVAVVGAYAALAGWVPPVVRSFVMGTAAIGALVWRQQYSATHWLGLAVGGMLLYQPYAMYDVSFQLSVGATAGILFLASPIYRYGRRYIPSSAALAVSVTISAQVLLVPFLLYYFHMLPAYAVISNLTVGVLLEMAIVVCLAAIIGQWIPPVGGYLAWWGSRCIEAAVVINSRIAHWPGAHGYSRGWEWPEALVYYLLIFSGYMAWRAQGKGRRKWWAACVCGALCLGAVLWGRQDVDAGVVVPDAGASRGVMIEHAGTCLVYYREGSYAHSRTRELAEFASAVEYFGGFRPTVWIHEPAVADAGAGLLTSVSIVPQEVRIYPPRAERGEIAWRWADGWTAAYTTAGMTVRDERGETVVAVPMGPHMLQVPVGASTCLVLTDSRQHTLYEKRLTQGERPAALVTAPLRTRDDGNTETVFTWLELTQYRTDIDGCIDGTYRNGKWKIDTYE